MMWPLKSILTELNRSDQFVVDSSVGKLIIKRDFYHNMPYVLAYNSNLPTPGSAVFFVHGLGDCASLGIKTALELAAKGFTAVLPEMPWHGVLEPDNRSDLFNGENFVPSILRVISRGVQAISALTSHLQQNALAAPGDCGISGFSMGGYVTYMMPLIDQRFTVLAPVSGSPYRYNPKTVEYFGIERETLKDLAKYDVPEAAQHAEDLSKTAILIQHAVDDETVASADNQHFFELLQPFYRDRPDELKAIFYPTGGHLYQDQMRDEVVEWFGKHLHKN